MTTSRHRADAPALHVRARRLAVPGVIASCVTGFLVAAGIAVADGGSVQAPVAGADTPVLEVSVSDFADRTRTVSREARRVELEPRAVAKRYATADLNIWSRASDKSKKLGEVELGARIAVTGQMVQGWAEVLLKGEVRYVNAKYLSEEKPDEVATSTATSTAPCPDGSGTESGLTTTAAAMFRAVCNAFPALEVYGGYDNHGEHADGRAVDFMTYENQELGWAIAEWARARATALNIRTIIFAQRIWTVERSSEGWRGMSDRGSVTANHYDHPHISVY